MILNLIREYHWAPDIIGALYVDRVDYKGVELLHDDLVKMHSELKKK
jgi:hypothetical protein